MPRSRRRALDSFCPSRQADTVSIDDLVKLVAGLGFPVTVAMVLLYHILVVERSEAIALERQTQALLQVVQELKNLIDLLNPHRRR